MSESVTLDHEDRAEIYDYVERRGSVSKKEVITGTLDQRRALTHHVAILKRDGYLEKASSSPVSSAICNSPSSVSSR
jgi:predicted transcriptional regulator